MYLYRYEDYARYKQRQDEVSAIEDAIQEGHAKSLGLESYEDLSETQQERAYGLVKYWRSQQEDLDEWGDIIDSKHAGEQDQIEIDSKFDPEHMFKVGYFRSSYNGSGIDRVLHDSIGKTLAYIFEPSGEYIVQPDWKSCLQRAQEVYNEFCDFNVKNDNLSVMTVDVKPNVHWKDEMPVQPSEALQFFQKERAKHTGGWDSYSNGYGYFSLEKPMKIRAIIQGVNKDLTGIFRDRDCVFVVYENEEGNKWYETALQIVIETIEHVLSQPDPENHILHWSG